MNHLYRIEAPTNRMAPRHCTTCTARTHAERERERERERVAQTLTGQMLPETDAHRKNVTPGHFLKTEPNTCRQAPSVYFLNASVSQHPSQTVSRAVPIPSVRLQKIPSGSIYRDASKIRAKLSLVLEHF